MIAEPATPRVPQRYRVLALAKRRGDLGITRATAATHVGCFELASRIGELQDEGVTFDRRVEHDHNRFGDPVRFTRYVVKHIPPDLQEHASWAPRRA